MAHSFEAKRDNDQQYLDAAVVVVLPHGTIHESMYCYDRARREAIDDLYLPTSTKEQVCMYVDT